MTQKPSISWLFFLFLCPVKVGRWLVITSRVGQEALTMTILSWTCTSQDLSKEQDFWVSSISHLSLSLTPISITPGMYQVFHSGVQRCPEWETRGNLDFIPCPLVLAVFASVWDASQLAIWKLRKRYSYLSVSTLSQSNHLNLAWGVHSINPSCPALWLWAACTVCAPLGATGKVQGNRTSHLSCTLRQDEPVASCVYVTLSRVNLES